MLEFIFKSFRCIRNHKVMNYFILDRIIILIFFGSLALFKITSTYTLNNLLVTNLSAQDLLNIIQIPYIIM